MMLLIFILYFHLHWQQNEKDQYNKLSMVESSAGKLTFTCDLEKPTVNLNILIENIGANFV